MTTMFEQPKHLNSVIYQRLVHVAWPLFLVYGGLVSAMLLLALWHRAAIGERVVAWRWIPATGFGFLIAALVLLGLLLERFRRRYVEFRGDRLYLAQCGVVPIRRLITWSLSPDSAEPKYTRLQLVFRLGFGRMRWSMLLDDDTHVAELRHALTLQVPRRDAT